MCWCQQAVYLAFNAHGWWRERVARSAVARGMEWGSSASPRPQIRFRALVVHCLSCLVPCSCSPCSVRLCPHECLQSPPAGAECSCTAVAATLHSVSSHTHLAAWPADAQDAPGRALHVCPTFAIPAFARALSIAPPRGSSPLYAQRTSSSLPQDKIPPGNSLGIAASIAAGNPA